jgi:threonylcarbamoyladenosine tRNA methylthiotransferase MtaB
MRVSLHTFGCKANQYDTELVREALELAGATVVDGDTTADAAVVNSCTVTHVSEAKMRGLVRRLARANPSLRTVVIGCAAATDDGPIAALPGVVRVVGGAEPSKVLEALDLPCASVPRRLRSFHGGRRAWLKIQDGCDEHCTFCATRRARGSSRSRAADEIVEEAVALAETHAEIVLTGVHVGAYGADLDRGLPLSGLLDLLIRHVPDVRFRLTSVEATELDDRLVDLMAGAPERLAPHLHAPLQSGSDRMLKRMGRRWYTADAYRARVDKIATRLDRLGLGADVMVGFPGETNEDFALTRAVVDELPFTYLHVFPYSERPGSPSRSLGPAVRPQVVASRAATLRAAVLEKRAAYRSRRAGQRADVVLVRRSNGEFEGLTEDYLTVRGAAGESLAPRFEALLSLDDGGGLRGRPVEPSA